MAGQYSLISSGSAEGSSRVSVMPTARHQLVISPLGASPYLFTRALYWPRIGQLFLLSGTGLEFHDAWVQGDSLKVEFSAPRYGDGLIDVRPLIRDLRDLFGSASTEFALYALEYPAGSENPANPPSSKPGWLSPGLLPQASEAIPWVAIAAVAAIFLLVDRR